MKNFQIHAIVNNMSIKIFVDVEASDKTPITGKLVQIGAVSEDGQREYFAELWPNTPHPDIPALPVVSDDAVPLRPLREVAQEFHDWLESFNEKVVFVSDNNGYDYMWIACFFDEFGLDNPFGHSSRRIGDIYAGINGKINDANSWKRFRKTEHTHKAVDDARGNQEAFSVIKKMFEKR